VTAPFVRRYGPWALIAGASEGLGAAFATELARRGLNLILVARRPDPLRDLAARLPTRAVTVAADLSTADGLAAGIAAGAEHEVGLVIANAAYSPIGPFVALSPSRSDRAVRLNCAAPVALAHAFLPAMAERGRGGMVIMSSLAGQQGSPPITVYGATKAFGAVLAEGLWAEMRPRGVDVVACVAGAIATPGLEGALGGSAASGGSAAKRAPGTLPPERVVAAALRGLGRGPRVHPGVTVKLSSVLMSRLLPRRAAIAIISRASRGLIPPAAS
jgi:uncharacterized protein